LKVKRAGALFSILQFRWRTDAKVYSLAYIRNFIEHSFIMDEIGLDHLYLLRSGWMFSVPSLSVWSGSR
jgi:hypothetical protein